MRGRGKNGNDGNKPAFARKRRAQAAMPTTASLATGAMQELLAGPVSWQTYQEQTLRTNPDHIFKVDLARLGGQKLEGYNFKNCEFDNSSNVALEADDTRFENCSFTAESLHESKLTKCEIVSPMIQKGTKISGLNWTDVGFSDAKVEIEELGIYKSKFDNVLFKAMALRRPVFEETELKNSTFKDSTLNSMSWYKVQADNVLFNNSIWHDAFTIDHSVLNYTQIEFEEENGWQYLGGTNFHSSEINNLSLKKVQGGYMRSEELSFYNSALSNLSIEDSQISGMSIRDGKSAEDITLKNTEFGSFSISNSTAKNIMFDNAKANGQINVTSYGTLPGDLNFYDAQIENMQAKGLRLSYGMKCNRSNIKQSSFEMFAEKGNSFGSVEVENGTWDDVQVKSLGHLQFRFKSGWMATGPVKLGGIFAGEFNDLTFDHDAVNQNIDMGDAPKRLPLESSLRIFADKTPDKEKVRAFGRANPAWFKFLKAASPWTMSYDGKRRISHDIQSAKPGLFDRLFKS